MYSGRESCSDICLFSKVVGGKGGVGWHCSAPARVMFFFVMPYRSLTSWRLSYGTARRFSDVSKRTCSPFDIRLCNFASAKTRRDMQVIYTTELPTALTRVREFDHSIATSPAGWSSTAKRKFPSSDTATYLAIQEPTVSRPSMTCLSLLRISLAAFKRNAK